MHKGPLGFAYDFATLFIMLLASAIQRLRPLQRISTPLVHAKRFKVGLCRFQLLVEPRESVREEEFVDSLAIKRNPTIRGIEQILELNNRSLGLDSLSSNATAGRRPGPLTGPATTYV